MDFDIGCIVRCMEPNAQCLNEYNCMDFDRPVDYCCMNSNKVDYHGDFDSTVDVSLAGYKMAEDDIQLVYKGYLNRDLLVDDMMAVVGVDGMMAVVGVDDMMAVVGVDDMMAVVGVDDMMAVVGVDDMMAVVGVDGMMAVVGVDGMMAVVGVDDMMAVVGVDDMMAVVGVDGMMAVVGVDDMMAVVGVDGMMAVVGVDGMMAVEVVVVEVELKVGSGSQVDTDSMIRVLKEDMDYCHILPLD